MPLTGKPDSKPDPTAVIGDYTLVTSLGRDRLGEACIARGPDGLVRVRLVTPDSSERAALDRRLDVAAAIRHPALAPIVDRLVDDSGRIAIVTTTDVSTLAARRSAEATDATARAAITVTLLEGLASLHAAGLAHGGVARASVGIDSNGIPRWQDWAVWAPAGTLVAAQRADVARMLNLTRALGALPPRLERVIEDAGESPAGTRPSAGELARELRAAARDIGIALHPEGTAPALAGLLPRQRAPRRVRLPRWVRPITASAYLVAAGGLVPIAANGTGSAPAFLNADAYLPARAGMTLTYAFVQHTALGGHTGSIALVVAQRGAVAGELSVVLAPAPGTDSTTTAALPLGLGGTTIRFDGIAIGRAAAGGDVRDLVTPLRPGSQWSDRRVPAPGFTTVETRTLLGPLSTTVPAGAFSHCVAVAVAVTSTTAVAGQPGATAHGTAVICEGVGLTRARLTGSTEDDAIDLQSAS